LNKENNEHNLRKNETGVKIIKLIITLKIVFIVFLIQLKLYSNGIKFFYMRNFFTLVKFFHFVPLAF